MTNEKLDLVFHGADKRPSLYDVIYPKNGAKLPLLIFCHGFKGFKDWGHFPILCRTLANSGRVVVPFNFSHNGVGLQNKFDFTDLEAFAKNNYLRELEDISRLLDHLEVEEDRAAHRDFNDISIIGHSRGGSMALLAGTNDPRIKRMITLAAVSDLFSRLAEDEQLIDWEEKGVRYILNGRTKQQMPMNFQFVRSLRNHKDSLNLRTKLINSSKPILILHGEQDQTVDVSQSYELKEWCMNGEHQEIAGANHTFGGTHPYPKEQLPETSEKALKAIIDFLERHAG